MLVPFLLVDAYEYEVRSSRSAETFLSFKGMAALPQRISCERWWFVRALRIARNYPTGEDRASQGVHQSVQHHRSCCAFVA